jgi:hypothetical protein
VLTAHVYDIRGGNQSGHHFQLGDHAFRSHF